MPDLIRDLASFVVIVAFVVGVAVVLPDLSAAVHGDQQVIVADRGEG
ncbi:hypothetical protein [Rhizobium alvei]|uniref:Uncharacterized protein n=1 Tax=Rhizobium alvei TaxID=1132659 RepID=A0ABT8YKX6_9HYPH|nr:hypothetical protein [Rhizobium alvei]MDO6963998.1 hypothetical protein [Rhizobium alvei]